METANPLFVAPLRPRKFRRLPEMPEIRAEILGGIHELRVRDPELIREFVLQRQKMDVDQHDEVWEGVYVVPPLANIPHQNIIQWLSNVLFDVVNLEKRGMFLPGANVSDRRKGWNLSFRAPDIVVVLNGSAAKDCGTHWYGGPDFLVEARSGKQDVLEEKLPFYARIGVRELLVIDRDSRELTLFRTVEGAMVAVEMTVIGNKKWLVSEVVPIAIRRKVVRGIAQTEVIRTDGQPGKWTF